MRRRDSRNGFEERDDRVDISTGLTAYALQNPRAAKLVESSASGSPSGALARAAWNFPAPMEGVYR